MTRATAPLSLFHPAVRDWFSGVFEAPTRPQRLGWPAIARGESTLILAPTGSGKTLTAFLWCLNRLLFEPVPEARRRCRVLYVSPLKALAVDVERNLRAPLAGIANVATAARCDISPSPGIAIRTGDTPANERARFLRAPADILITTPESLFLLLTSRARERLAAVDTVIVDEIHALVPGKRGAHLALVARTARGAACVERRPPPAAAAHRPLGHAAAARRGGALSRRRGRSADRGGPPVSRRSEGGFSAALRGRRPAPTRTSPRPNCTTSSARRRRRVSFVPSPSSTRRTRSRCRSGSRCRSKTWPASAARSRSGRPERSRASQRPARVSIWASIYPRLLELDPRAPLDAALRQQPAARRAAGRRAQRPGRGTAGALAPRLAGARGAQRGGGPAEGRDASARSSRPRRSSSASTWAPSTWSCRSKRRRRWRAACSASAAPATRWARPAKA